MNLAPDDPTDLQSRFVPHPLREYALLADGHRGALRGPHGDIVWLCAPRWHDDAVFAALLGGGGHYSVRPRPPYIWEGSYEPRTLIWRGRWATHHGFVECRDALAYPGDPGRVVLLRRIEAVERDAVVLVDLDVRAGFGAYGMRDLARDDAGRWHARSGPLTMRWTGAEHAVVVEDGALATEITVPAGHHHDLVLELASPAAHAGAEVDADAAWAATEEAWAYAVPDLGDTIAGKDAHHAYAVLRGMTVPGGGMAAAASMALPERAGQARNYDYRYSWVRDQCYAGIAAAAYGPHPLLDDAVSFLTARVLDDGDRLAPAYTVDGGEVPGERRLGLPGYPGGDTVAAGNRAGRQFQLDSYGELLQLLAAAARLDRLDADGWKAVKVAAGAVGDRWRDADSGIWELEPAWWTHSRLSCVAGLRAVARITPSTGDADGLGSLADRILEETTRRCRHPRGYWQRAPGRPDPDASLVLPPVRGALPADDPRTRATLDVVRRELAQDGYVHRFRHGRHRLGEVEGAFLLCGFHLALADHQRGDEISAFRWFERGRAACGPPGLFTEEYDTHRRLLRGNLPQAFVHAALLECSARLAVSG